MLHKRIISLLAVLCIFQFQQLQGQLDTFRVQKLTNLEIQDIVDNAISAGGGVVLLPAGECVIDNDIDFELEEGDSLKIIGSGTDQTILKNGSDTRIQIEQTGYGGNFVEISNITFRSDTIDGAASVIAIQLRGPENFHIHHCRFNGRWHGMISLFKTKKGLIDHCVSRNSISPQGYYGIIINSYYQASSVSDSDFWAENWDYDRNKLLGSVNSVFVEDCIFHNFHTSILTNWASFGKLTIRHNTFYAHDGYTQVGWKSGGYFSEMYNNTFVNTGPAIHGGCSNIRTGGLIYNNTYRNLSITGHFWAFDTAFNYVYPPHTLMNNLYIWDNNYENCNYTEDAVIVNYGAPWVIMRGEGIGCDTGGYTGHLPLNEGDEIFVRAPQSGDEIYPYTAFPYPHPMITGEEMPSSIKKKNAKIYCNIFPIPSASLLNINFNSEKNEDILIKVFDLSGHSFYFKRERFNFGNHTKTIDIENLSNGVYIIQITGNSFSHTQSIIKN